MSDSNTKSASGNLLLLVSEEGCAKQLFETTSRNLTVGSGKNCELRLQPENSAEQQCQFLRGIKKTIVRSLSPETQLNGAVFHETWLKDGDVLSFNNTTIEVMAVDLDKSQPLSMPSSAQSPSNAQLATGENAFGKDCELYAEVKVLKQNVAMAGTLRRQLEEGKVTCLADLIKAQELLDSMVRHAKDSKLLASAAKKSDETNCLPGTFEVDETEQIDSDAVDVEVVESFDRKNNYVVEEVMSVVKTEPEDLAVAEVHEQVEEISRIARDDSQLELCEEEFDLTAFSTRQFDTPVNNSESK